MKRIWPFCPGPTLNGQNFLELTPLCIPLWMRRSPSSPCQNNCTGKLCLGIPFEFRISVGQPGASVNIEALCAAPPEALTHSPSRMPLSCPVAPQAARSWKSCKPPRLRRRRHAPRNTSFSAFGAARLRRRAPSHLQSLYEVWHGAGCQIRRQAGRSAANSFATT